MLLRGTNGDLRQRVLIRLLCEILESITFLYLHKNNNRKMFLPLIDILKFWSEPKIAEKAVWRSVFFGKTAPFFVFRFNKNTLLKRAFY